jgi:hypothetical protein
MTAEIISIAEARRRRFASGPPPQSKLEREAFAAFWRDNEPPTPPRAA